MHPLTASTLRSCLRFGLILLALPLLAHASLPASSNVPGGVAIVQLGSTHTAKPQAWLADQAVLVTSERKRWYAVVGLPLDMQPGSHELRVKVGDATSSQPSRSIQRIIPNSTSRLKTPARCNSRRG